MPVEHFLKEAELSQVSAGTLLATPAGVQCPAAHKTNRDARIAGELISVAQ